MKSYSCDFETTTDPNDCRVWAYGCCEIGNIDNFIYGNNIDDFLKWCEKENKNIYFQNLKFDGSFIINRLLQLGFVYSDEKIEKSFSCVMNMQNQMYSISIVFKRFKRNLRHVKIFDSLKKLPFSVKNLAIAFHLPILKGSIDYDEYRPVGHILTENEIAYLKNDVQIVAMALQIQFEQNLKKMTIASDAFTFYKNMISDKLFKKLFPVIDKVIDDDIRQAYRGGFTWCNPKFKNKNIGKGIVFDVNSLYPHVMYNCNLPYGLPIFFEGKYEIDNNYPLYIQNMIVHFKLKKNHIPTIQLKNNPMFCATEYITDSKEPIPLILSSVDLELLYEHYDILYIEFINGWKFKASNSHFKAYIDYWMKVKMKNTGAIRELAKLMLNSLYGKFGSSCNVTGRIPYLENNILKWKNGEAEYKDPVYTALAVFVTANARKITISTAQACFDRIIYCDTDSIHLVETNVPDEIKEIVHPKKLGYWKHESTFTRGRFLRAKTYIEEMEISKSDYDEMKEKDKNDMRYYISHNKYYMLNVKCAGMPDEVKKIITWDNFHYGFKNENKLKFKSVQNGVILEKTEFTIKP